MGKMKVTRKVLPGNHGAVRETTRFGDKLLAVRYHKDDKGYFCKTAEVIVYERYAGKQADHMPLSGM